MPQNNDNNLISDIAFGAENTLDTSSVNPIDSIKTNGVNTLLQKKEKTPKIEFDDKFFSTPSERLKSEIAAIDADAQFYKPVSKNDVYKFNTSTNPITKALLGDYTARYNKYLPGADNETLNAKDQSGASVAWNALGGMLFNAGESFSGAIAANGRAIDAAKNGDWSKMWDTEFTENQAKDLATASDYFAIYHDATKPSGLSSYIPFFAGSGEKWGHLVQSFGFTIGTLGYVAAENAAFAYTTGGIGNLLRSGKTIKGIFDAARMLSFADKGADALKGLTAAQKLAANGLRYAKNVNVALNAAASESSMEAGIAGLESMDESIAKYKELYGVEPDEAEIQKIKEQREKVGNTTFSLNAPILLASNFAMFGNYMRTGKFFSKPISELSTRAVVEGTKAELKKGIATNAWRASKKIAGVVPEGLEEVSQSIASESAKRHYDLYKSDTGKSFLDTMSVVSGDLYKSGRMAEDFLSGAIIGGISMGIGAINDKFRGKQDNVEDKLNQYNTTISENIQNAIEGIGSRRMPNQVFGVAGALTANKLQAGMEGMNAMAGQIVASQNKDKKEFYDYHNDSTKAIAYANWSNGMSQIGKEVVNANIDAVPANEYAAQYMTGQPTDEQITDHKERKKAEFAALQDRFDADMDIVEERYGNPINKLTNPNEWQSWEEVKRDIAFYKQDYRDAVNRAGSLNKSISSGINKFYEETGIKIEEKDIDILVSQSAREKEIANIEEEGKTLKAQLSALDGTIHTEQQKDIREKLAKLEDRKSSIKTLVEITKASEMMDKNDTATKKAYQKGVNEWLKKSTGLEFGAENPLMQDISDLLVLESEGKFLLSLHNALMSNSALMKQYHKRYSTAARRAQKEGLEKLQEKHREETGQEKPKDEKEKRLEDDFTPEEIAEMQKVLGAENLYEVEKETIQKAIDELYGTTDDNAELISNLETLKSGAYVAPKPILDEEARSEAEAKLEAAKKEKEAIEKAIENDKDDISEQEYQDFIDNNTVSQERLNSLYEKVKNNEKFSTREMAMMQANLKPIEELLAKSFSEPTTSNQSEIDAKKAEIEREISEIEDAVNSPYFATKEIFKKHWKTRVYLFANKIKQLRELLKNGINSGEDVYKATILLNDVRSVLNEGIDPNETEFSILLELKFEHLGKKIRLTFPEKLIFDYVDIMNDKMKSRGMTVDKDLQKLKGVDVWNIDGKNSEYFLYDWHSLKKKALEESKDVALQNEQKSQASNVKKNKPKARKKGDYRKYRNIPPTTVDEAIYQYFLNGGAITYEALGKIFGRVDEKGVVLEDYKSKVDSEKATRMAIIRKEKNGGKSIERIAELILPELPDNLRDGNYTSDVEDFIRTYSGFETIADYYDRILAVDDLTMEDISGQRDAENEEILDDYRKRATELADIAEGNDRTLTEEEKSELQDYIEYASMPFNDVVEDESLMYRIDAILNPYVKDNTPLPFQKVSKYENILSPAEMRIARKLLSRAFPNIIEMTDDEVFKAMNGLKLPIGMMLNGKMWVNSERETLETRMHELGGHVFFLAMKNQYPSLYERLMGQLTDSIDNKSSKELNEVVKFVKELYPELSVGSSQFNEEVMATYMGQIMRDGVAKAIKSKGIKSDIAYWLNYIYERLMNLLGIDNYLSMDKFANNTLGENLVHIGKGILNGRVRSDVSTDELATMMSASPTYMKGITNELEELKKAIDILPAIESQNIKEKIVVRKNKSTEDWDKEKDGNFSFLSLYDMGVSVDEVMVSAKDYDKDNHIVKTLADLSGDKPDPRDIVQVFYSNGLGNILSEQELNALNQLGIKAFDSSVSESYGRGRIFFYRTSPSDKSIKSVLEEVAKLSFPDKRGIHKLSKDGKEISSTSDLAQKVNKEALLKVKTGDEVAVSIDFNNEWNKGIVEKAMRGEKLNVTDYETIVLSYRDQQGEVLGYVRALNGAFDKEESDNKRKDRIEGLRKKANQMLESAIKNKQLVTSRMQSLQREMNLPSTTDERKAFIQGLIDEAYEKSSAEDFLPLDLFSIPAIGTQAIYNETIDEWMPISEFIEKREAMGDSDFELAFFKQNEAGEWKYFNQKGKELDIIPDTFDKYEAVYLVSPNYQRRAYFNTEQEREQYSTFEEFQSLDPSIVSTRLNPDKPYLDVRLKVDLGISPKINRTTSKLEETALNEEGKLSVEQEAKGDNVEVSNEIADDVKTSADELLETAPQSTLQLSQQDEEFIYDMIPLYYGLEPNSDMYRAQGIMVDEMNDGLLSKGIKLTSAVGDLPKEYFSRILESYKSLMLGQNKLKSFIFDVVKNKEAMDNQILIEGDNLIAPKAPEGAKVIRIDEVNLNRLTLLFDAQAIYVQHKDTNFYYEFPKKNFSVPIEKQVKNAIRLVMMANGEKMSNFDAFYQEYTRNNINLSVEPQEPINLVRVATSPYSVYKLAKSENIVNDIKC